MQPQPMREAVLAEREWTMEHVILEVRRLWFGAQERSLAGAISVIEPGGELLMLLRATAGQADSLIGSAALRGAYVVATSSSQPRDLVERLQREGYRSIQRHGAYVYDPTVAMPAPPPRSLLTFLRRIREPLEIGVQAIGKEEMPLWSDVCWRSFGPRGTRESSLQEKLRAFENMGDRGRWYLAHVGGRPVGTACLYQSERAAQILAVGTLPGFRGRGVASAVLNRALADWGGTGRGFLFLDTVPDGPAERLYQRFGFRPAYQRELYAPVRTLP